MRRARRGAGSATWSGSRSPTACTSPPSSAASPSPGSATSSTDDPVTAGQLADIDRPRPGLARPVRRRRRRPRAAQRQRRRAGLARGRRRPLPDDGAGPAPRRAAAARRAAHALARLRRRPGRRHRRPARGPPAARLDRRRGPPAARPPARSSALRSSPRPMHRPRGRMPRWAATAVADGRSSLAGAAAIWTDPRARRRRSAASPCGACAPAPDRPRSRPSRRGGRRRRRSSCATGCAWKPLVRRADLVSQLRFAVTMQDLRTVVLLRRQLRGEQPRDRAVGHASATSRRRQPARRGLAPRPPRHPALPGRPGSCAWPCWPSRPGRRDGDHRAGHDAGDRRRRHRALPARPRSDRAAVAGDRPARPQRRRARTSRAGCSSATSPRPAVALVPFALVGALVVAVVDVDHAAARLRPVRAASPGPGRAARSSASCATRLEGPTKPSATDAASAAVPPEIAGFTSSLRLAPAAARSARSAAVTVLAMRAQPVGRHRPSAWRCSTCSSSAATGFWVLRRDEWSAAWQTAARRRPRRTRAATDGSQRHEHRIGPGARRSPTCRSRTATRRPSARSTSPSRPASGSRWSATTAAARPRCCGWPPACSTPPTARSSVAGHDVGSHRGPRVRQLAQRPADVLRRPVAVGAPRVRRPAARHRRLGAARRRPARAARARPSAPTTSPPRSAAVCARRRRSRWRSSDRSR